MMTNIETLIKGRHLINKYNNITKIKGQASPSDDFVLKGDLLNLGFESKEEFLKFNIEQNLKEIDRCYVPVFLNTKKIVPCTMDKCLFNSSPCHKFMNEKVELKKYNMTASQLNGAYERSIYTDNIKLLFTPEYFLKFQNYKGYTPEYCLFEFIKINEPRFDVFWGTEKYKEFGNDIQKNIETHMANERNIIKEEEQDIYFIINKRTSEYFVIKNESLDKNWKIKYPISKTAKWKDLFLFKKSDFKKTSNDIFYIPQHILNDEYIIYLFGFVDIVSIMDIEWAKNEIQKKYNVIFFKTLRLKRKF